MRWNRNIQEKLADGIKDAKESIERAQRQLAFVSYLAANMKDTKIVGAEMESPYTSIFLDDKGLRRIVFKIEAHEKDENGYGSKYDYHVGLRNLMRRFKVRTMKRCMSSGMSNRPEWYFKGVGKVGRRKFEIEFRLGHHVPLGCKVEVVRRRRTWSTSVQYSASCGVR